MRGRCHTSFSSLVLFYLLSTCTNKGEVINHMMNRFSMLSTGLQGYDSFIVLSNKTNKQLQANLSSFNSQFHNVIYHPYYQHRFNSSKPPPKQPFSLITKPPTQHIRIFIHPPFTLFRMLISSFLAQPANIILSSYPHQVMSLSQAQPSFREALSAILTPTFIGFVRRLSPR